MWLHTPDNINEEGRALRYRYLPSPATVNHWVDERALEIHLAQTRAGAPQPDVYTPPSGRKAKPFFYVWHAPVEGFHKVGITTNPDASVRMEAHAALHGVKGAYLIASWYTADARVLEFNATRYGEAYASEAWDIVRLRNFVNKKGLTAKQKESRKWHVEYWRNTGAFPNWWTTATLESRVFTAQELTDITRYADAMAYCRIV